MNKTANSIGDFKTNNKQTVESRMNITNYSQEEDKSLIEVLTELRI
jgi:hypothetical protein